jgi:hypothetical protein
MNFKSLSIERKSWGKNELQGSVVFGNNRGRINLQLTDEHINKIFGVVADTMIETAKEAAAELTCNIIEHKAEIESKQPNNREV